MEDPSPFYTAVDAALSPIAAESAPSWADAFQTLNGESTLDDRLRVFKLVREARTLPEEAGFFLVARQIDLLVERDEDANLSQMEDALADLREQLGIDDIPASEAPEEYAQALRFYNQRWAEFYARGLERYGEPEMAQLFETDEEGFNEVQDSGRLFFFPAQTDWLEDLFLEVTGCVECDCPMSPFLLEYETESDFWDVTIFAPPVELVGGPDDGSKVVADFRVNLGEFHSVFDHVVDFGWSTLGLEDGGPFIWIEGTYQGRDLFVRLLAHAHPSKEAGGRLDTNTGEFRIG